MLKIAITGASGFVGTNLQNYLDGEYLIQLSDHLQFTKTYKLLIFK